MPRSVTLPVAVRDYTAVAEMTVNFLLWVSLYAQEPSCKSYAAFFFFFPSSDFAIFNVRNFLILPLTQHL